MKTTDARSTSQIIAAANPQAFAHYKPMREAFGNADSLDRKTYETVIAVQFALLGKEVQFKVHAMRLFALGLSRQDVQALVLAGAGLTVIMCEAAQAATWAEEAYDEYQAASGRR